MGYARAATFHGKSGDPPRTEFAALVEKHAAKPHRVARVRLTPTAMRKREFESEVWVPMGDSNFSSPCLK